MNSIFWFGIILLITSNATIPLWKNSTWFLQFFIIFQIIGIAIILTSTTKEKFREWKSGYKSAYLTGTTPGGAVYVNNPGDYPGLGWVL